MCEDAKFDLRVVNCGEEPTRRGDKGATNLATKFSADRDILEIGIGGGESACNGNCLIKNALGGTIEIIVRVPDRDPILLSDDRE
jgi:hypothetical protein